MRGIVPEDKKTRRKYNIAIASCGISPAMGSVSGDGVKMVVRILRRLASNPWSRFFRLSSTPGTIDPYQKKTCSNARTDPLAFRLHPTHLLQPLTSRIYLSHNNKQNILHFPLLMEANQEKRESFFLFLRLLRKEEIKIFYKNNNL